MRDTTFQFKGIRELLVAAIEPLQGSCDRRLILVDCLKSIAILGIATLLSIIFYHLKFNESNIIMVYILGVLVTSSITSHQIYSLVSSLSSVYLFNYLFIEPRFTLDAYAKGYPITFVVMFLSAYITATFAIRYKHQAAISARSAYRTSILLESEQLLVKAKDKKEIVEATVEQLVKLLNRGVIIMDAQEEVYGSSLKLKALLKDQREQEALRYALVYKEQVGASRKLFAACRLLYLPIAIEEEVYGVVGIELDQDVLDEFEFNIVCSLIAQSALAIENEKNLREKEATAILAESEQLRANMLRAISHDLRTPLTTISGNACNLMKNEISFDEATRKGLYEDIYKDAQWLIQLVENLLYATRMEEGKMVLQTSSELVSDLINEAIYRINNKCEGKRVNKVVEDELVLVKVDSNLVVQVMVNLLTNAIKYTPSDATITISSSHDTYYAKIEVRDTGKGLSDEEKEHVFDKFYVGSRPVVDNRRSLGLGLFLCKAIVEAHGGEIEVRDNDPHGAIFSFTLPLEEVKSYE